MKFDFRQNPRWPPDGGLRSLSVFYSVVLLSGLMTVRLGVG